MCVCELCVMEIKTVLFDSLHNKWNINDSEFGIKVKGHRHVSIIIENTNGDIFGGYVSKEIGIKRFHFDEKSFVFSILNFIAAANIIYSPTLLLHFQIH